MNILWIFCLYIIGINANSVTITASNYYNIQTFVCNSKNIQIDLQFSSDNGNIRFYTLDTCSSLNYYNSLSVRTALSTFSGTLTGTVSETSVCLQFYNTNIIQSTTVTYTINTKCIDSTASDAGFVFGSLLGYLIVFGPIVLLIICCCVCIRYYYNRGTVRHTFVRMEQQQQALPMQVVTTVPDAQG